jgi:hypothetical protein
MMLPLSSSQVGLAVPLPAQPKRRKKMWTILGSSGLAGGAWDISGEIGWLMVGIVLVWVISASAIAVMASIDARSERVPVHAEVPRRSDYRRAA